MLDQLIADDDIADGEFLIQPPGDTGENHRAAIETIEQQAAHQAGSHLAHPRLGENHRMSVDPAMAKAKSCDGHIAGGIECRTQARHLLRHCREDGQRSVGQGQARL